MDNEQTERALPAHVVSQVTDEIGGKDSHFEGDVAVELGPTAVVGHPRPEDNAAERREITEMESWRAVADARYDRMRRGARAVGAAVEGWSSVRTTEEWEHVCDQAVAGYRSGQFLIERLGAERYLDPTLMATLWGLRDTLLADLGEDPTMAEMMLVDLTVLSYYNALRAQRWIGDAAMLTEHAFFGQEGPSVQLRQRFGREQVAGLAAEERIERLTERLLPLLDRANRLVIRNLKAMQDLRRPPATPTTTVAIAQAGQVNVGNQQANVVSPAQPCDGTLDRESALGDA